MQIVKKNRVIIIKFYTFFENYGVIGFYPVISYHNKLWQFEKATINWEVMKLFKFNMIFPVSVGNSVV